MLLLGSLLKITLLLQGFLSAAGAGPRPRLRFGPDGRIKIAQFTDLHYGNAADTDLHSDQVGAHRRGEGPHGHAMGQFLMR